MTAAVARDRLWPLWGVAAGIAGFTATVLMDTRPESELLAAEQGRKFTLDASYMNEVAHTSNYLGFLIGFVAVACLVVFAAAWRSRVELQHTRSIAASVVSGGLLVSAAGLALAYGWKGALANYGYTGNEFGLFDDAGLYVYYILTDFGPYIPWLGVLVSFAGMAWLAWAERLVSRILGTLLALYVVFIAAAYAIMGVPGLAGPLSGAVLAAASLWLVIGRSRVTLRPLVVAPRRSAPATLETPVVAESAAESPTQS
jgi:hypothetical protein